MRLQQLRIALPRGVPGAPDAWAGIHCVVRTADGSRWLKDGGANVRASFAPAFLEPPAPRGGDGAAA